MEDEEEDDDGDVGMEDDEGTDEDDAMSDVEEEDEEDPLEIPDPADILAAKRAHPLFARLFRSKGEYWLATRPGRAGEWSQAGAMLTLAGGRPWFCCIERSEWETGSPEIDALVDHDLAAGGKYGDRRQELVFIGEKLDIPAIEATLDACLLNDEEWASWQKVMNAGTGPNKMSKEEKEEKEQKLADLFDDGFPDWDDPDAEDEDAMDHDHHGHSHNGHAHSHAKKPNGTVANGKAELAKPKHGIRKDGTVY